MSKVNDASHKDAIHSLPLTIQEEQVASVKNTARLIWWMSNTNDAPHMIAIHEPITVAQDISSPIAPPIAYQV
jgi:hypothetical protein